MLPPTTLPAPTVPARDARPVPDGDLELTLPVHAERLLVSKRRTDHLVRVATQTQARDVAVDEAVTRDGVVVEHVAVGRYVDEAPPVRQDGDLTIVPVIEEQVVLTRRLFLREEVHIRRVQTTARHRETVRLREQQIVVTREPAQLGAVNSITNAEGAPALAISRNGTAMSEETIVAVYDTPAHAQLAAADLEAAGVPSSAISQHSSAGASATTAGVSPEPGFWSRLFGGESEVDTTVYDRSVQGGSTVVTVKVGEAHVAQVTQILESHSPIDIDERASGYGLAGSTSTTGIAAGTTAATAYAGQTSLGSAVEGGTIQLAEETLAVGKRLVNRGGTRIRRYVVETPVEESVTLHSERVVLDRRPVTDGRAVKDSSFSDKSIEMLETAEEVVVAKTAHVVEEVSLRKEAIDRVETVRDTVRKEEVEIEQIPAAAVTTTSTDAAVTGTAPKFNASNI